MTQDANKKILKNTIALYCRSGNRSKRAASSLSSKGYRVIELATGYNGWLQAGKPVAKEQETE